MAAQICETCKKKGNGCYCAPNSTCEGYEPEKEINIIQKLFDYPLPNNGDRYDLSEEELVELLQRAYDNGRKCGEELNAVVTQDKMIKERIKVRD